jgi:hypothetical protein
MESLDTGLTSENNFSTTTEIKSYLIEAAKWGKFLAIMGYIGIGLMLLLAVGIMAAGSLTNLFPGAAMPIPMGAFGLIYIVIAAFYFFPVYYLHQFSIKIKQGLNSHDLGDVTLGFQNLKSLFKFMGIFTVVILSMYGVFILIAIVAGVAGMMR